MWTRSELKTRGKLAFKANYWSCVLVALIMTIVSAAAGGSSSSGGSDDAASGADIGSIISGAASEVGMSEASFYALLAGIVGVGLIIAIVISLFIKNVLVVGCDSFFLQNAKAQKPTVKEVLGGFSSNYLNIVITMFLKGLFISLWTLLFVIPGIIKAYEYRMIPYLLAENPEMTWKEAFAVSKQMMSGNKWNAFVLDLSFLGWYILSAFTCGILAVFWTNPYVFATDAELYLALKEQQ